MAGGRRTKRTKAKSAEAPPPAAPGSDAAPGPGGLPLPSPVAGTNLVIADIVLRAAGGLLRDRLEKGLIVKSYGATDKGRTKAEKLVDGRGVATNLALWGASHLARRSPLGLAVVAGGLAAKVFYDRGKRLETKRRAKSAPQRES
jgi:hypothetical protein